MISSFALRFALRFALSAARSNRVAHAPLLWRAARPTDLTDTTTDQSGAKQELVIRVVAMPSDTNPDGDMFGRWVLSQMDLGAFVQARTYTHTRIVTVAIKNIVFHKPVLVGDCLICYATTELIGQTSITVKINAMVERREGLHLEQVTEGRFDFVAIGGDHRPVSILME